MIEIVLNRPGEFGERETDAPNSSETNALVSVRSIGVCGTDPHPFAWGPPAAPGGADPPRPFSRPASRFSTIRECWGMSWGWK